MNKNDLVTGVILVFSSLMSAAKHTALLFLTQLSHISSSMSRLKPPVFVMNFRFGLKQENIILQITQEVLRLVNNYLKYSVFTTIWFMLSFTAPLNKKWCFNGCVFSLDGKGITVVLLHSCNSCKLETFNLTCFSWSSELTRTLQISQWKVLSWVLGSTGPPPCSPLGLGPKRGYALMGPSPLRASRIVLCLVPDRYGQIDSKVIHQDEM